MNEHFRIEITTAPNPVGFSSCATRGCMCCGSVLSFNGGGGRYLCGECLRMIDTGEMQEAIFQFKRHQERPDA